MKGDTLVVWRLDRLGRNLADLVKLIADLEQRKINFESLTEKIETGSPAGRLVFHVFAALAEFERNLIRERTVAGLKAARARGRTGGRPAKLSPEEVKRFGRYSKPLIYPSPRSRLALALQDRPSTGAVLGKPTKRYTPEVAGE